MPVIALLGAAVSFNDHPVCLDHLGKLRHNRLVAFDPHIGLHSSVETLALWDACDGAEISQMFFAAHQAGSMSMCTLNITNQLKMPQTTLLDCQGRLPCGGRSGNSWHRSG